MQTQNGPKRPTAAELGILRVLWKLGPSTVRDVYEALPAESQVGYTTVLKLLQIMHEKGLVARDASERAHVYEARSSKEQTQGQLVRDLLNKAFDGSASELVIRLLGSNAATSARELADIRELLDRLEQRPEGDEA